MINFSYILLIEAVISFLAKKTRFMEVLLMHNIFKYLKREGF